MCNVFKGAAVYIEVFIEQVLLSYPLFLQIMKQNNWNILICCACKSMFFYDVTWIIIRFMLRLLYLCVRVYFISFLLRKLISYHVQYTLLYTSLPHFELIYIKVKNDLLILLYLHNIKHGLSCHNKAKSHLGLNVNEINSVFAFRSIMSTISLRWCFRKCLLMYCGYFTFLQTFLAGSMTLAKEEKKEGLIFLMWDFEKELKGTFSRDVPSPSTHWSREKKDMWQMKMRGVEVTCLS